MAQKQDRNEIAYIAYRLQLFLAERNDSDVAAKHLTAVMESIRFIQNGAIAARAMILAEACRKAFWILW